MEWIPSRDAAVAVGIGHKQIKRYAMWGLLSSEKRGKTIFVLEDEVFQLQDERNKYMHLKKEMRASYVQHRERGKMTDENGLRFYTCLRNRRLEAHNLNGQEEDVLFHEEVTSRLNIKSRIVIPRMIDQGTLEGFLSKRNYFVSCTSFVGYMGERAGENLFHSREVSKMTGMGVWKIDTIAYRTGIGMKIDPSVKQSTYLFTPSDIDNLRKCT
jgi:hypothetical protein